MKKNKGATGQSGASPAGTSGESSSVPNNKNRGVTFRDSPKIIKRYR